MAEIIDQIVTYQDVVEGIELSPDPYGIGAKFTPTRKDTFLANPNLKDYSKCLLCIKKVDNNIGGIAMFYPTRFKADGTIYDAVSGSELEVYEDFRTLALGADIVMYPIGHKENNFLIYAGLAELALEMYKKLRFVIFSYPRMMQLRKSRSIIESKGIHGGLLKVTFSIVDIVLQTLNKYWKLKSQKASKGFCVSKVTRVPEWVDDVVLNDGHKYMEVHDHKWLQWNLDYNFKGLKKDVQNFYIITKNGSNLGFFMTKERFRDVAGCTLKNIVIGSIMEWGTSNEKQLNEYDIHTIAMGTFSKNVDIVEMATTDLRVVRKMKPLGFIRQRDAHIGFKDLTRKYKDSNNPDLWRIRFGYADVFLT